MYDVANDIHFEVFAKLYILFKFTIACSLLEMVHVGLMVIRQRTQKYSITLRSMDGEKII